MNSLDQIIYNNKQAEKREKAGDFSEDEDCEECGCPIEDCVCLSYDYNDEVELEPGSDGLEGVDLDG